jgi:hypothetical protein
VIIRCREPFFAKLVTAQDVDLAEMGRSAHRPADVKLMSKDSLLEQLARARQKAEAAHLDAIVHSQLVSRLEEQNVNATEAKTKLAKAKMAEQKRLKELEKVT